MMAADFIMLLMIYRFMGKTGLFIWMALSSVIADIQVVKTTELFGFTVTLGNIVYGSSFLATDIISENYSKKDAHKSVAIGFASSIIMIVVMNFAIYFIPASEDFAHESLKTLFSIMPRVVFASLLAFAVSQTHDIWAYDFWKKKFPDKKFIFIRNNASTMVSQLIDSCVFTFSAFAGIYSNEVLIEIIITTYVMKWVVALFDTGCVYIAASWFKKGKIREF